MKKVLRRFSAYAGEGVEGLTAENRTGCPAGYGKEVEGTLQQSALFNKKGMQKDRERLTDDQFRFTDMSR